MVCFLRRSLWKHERENVGVSVGSLCPTGGSKAHRVALRLCSLCFTYRKARELKRVKEE